MEQPHNATESEMLADLPKHDKALLQRPDILAMIDANRSDPSRLVTPPSRRRPAKSA